MLTTMTSQGQASQAGCKTPYGSSPQRSARTSITVLASLVQAALFFVCPCCLVPSHRHASEAPPPPPPLRSYLPYLDKENKAKNKAVAAARRIKRRGHQRGRHQRWRHQPRTWPTSAKPVTQRFITESPLQQLGGARELSSPLRYKRPPPPGRRANHQSGRCTFSL